MNIYSQKTEYLELAVPLRTRTMLTDGDDSITGVLLLSSSGAWIAKNDKFHESTGPFD